ncbi:hypothetical protein ScPMuIL_002707 [Solemya velum]
MTKVVAKVKEIASKVFTFSAAKLIKQLYEETNIDSTAILPCSSNVKQTDHIPDDFLVADVKAGNDARHIIFAKEEQLQLLRDYMNERFSVVRKPFVQLYSFYPFLLGDSGLQTRIFCVGPPFPVQVRASINNHLNSPFMWMPPGGPLGSQPDGSVSTPDLNEDFSKFSQFCLKPQSALPQSWHSPCTDNSGVPTLINKLPEQNVPPISQPAVSSTSPPSSNLSSNSAPSTSGSAVNELELLVQRYALNLSPVKLKTSDKEKRNQSETDVCDENGEDQINTSGEVLDAASGCFREKEPADTFVSASSIAPKPVAVRMFKDLSLFVKRNLKKCLESRRDSPQPDSKSTADAGTNTPVDTENNAPADTEKNTPVKPYIKPIGTKTDHPEFSKKLVVVLDKDEAIEELLRSPMSCSSKLFEKKIKPSSSYSAKKKTSPIKNSCDSKSSRIEIDGLQEVSPKDKTDVLQEVSADESSSLNLLPLERGSKTKKSDSNGEDLGNVKVVLFRDKRLETEMSKSGGTLNLKERPEIILSKTSKELQHLRKVSRTSTESEKTHIVELMIPNQTKRLRNIHECYKLVQIGHVTAMECCTCRECFIEAKEFHKHLSKHHPTVYYCQNCRKEFLKLDELYVHLAERTMSIIQNKYICPCCQKTFVDLHEFICHLPEHIHIKSFLCPVCRWNFNNLEVWCKHYSEHLRSSEECSKNSLKSANQKGEPGHAPVDDVIYIADNEIVNTETAKSPRVVTLYPSKKQTSGDRRKFSNRSKVISISSPESTPPAPSLAVNTSVNIDFSDDSGDEKGCEGTDGVVQGILTRLENGGEDSVPSKNKSRKKKKLSSFEQSVGNRTVLKDCEVVLEKIDLTIESAFSSTLKIKPLECLETNKVRNATPDKGKKCIFSIQDEDEKWSQDSTTTRERKTKLKPNEVIKEKVSDETGESESSDTVKPSKTVQMEKGTKLKLRRPPGQNLICDSPKKSIRLHYNEKIPPRDTTDSKGRTTAVESPESLGKNTNMKLKKVIVANLVCDSPRKSTRLVSNENADPSDHADCLESGPEDSSESREQIINSKLKTIEAEKGGCYKSSDKTVDSCHASPLKSYKVLLQGSVKKKSSSKDDSFFIVENSPVKPCSIILMDTENPVSRFGKVKDSEAVNVGRNKRKRDTENDSGSKKQKADDLVDEDSDTQEESVGPAVSKKHKVSQPLALQSNQEKGELAHSDTDRATVFEEQDVRPVSLFNVAERKSSRLTQKCTDSTAIEELPSQRVKNHKNIKIEKSSPKKQEPSSPAVKRSPRSSRADGKTEKGRDGKTEEGEGTRRKSSDSSVPKLKECKIVLFKTRIDMKTGQGRKNLDQDSAETQEDTRTGETNISENSSPQADKDAIPSAAVPNLKNSNEIEASLSSEDENEFSKKSIESTQDGNISQSVEKDTGDSKNEVDHQPMDIDLSSVAPIDTALSSVAPMDTDLSSVAPMDTDISSVAPIDTNLSVVTRDGSLSQSDSEEVKTNSISETSSSHSSPEKTNGQAGCNKTIQEETTIEKSPNEEVSPVLKSESELKENNSIQTVEIGKSVIGESGEKVNFINLALDNISAQADPEALDNVMDMEKMAEIVAAVINNSEKSEMKPEQAPVLSLDMDADNGGLISNQNGVKISRMDPATSNSEPPESSSVEVLLDPEPSEESNVEASSMSKNTKIDSIEVSPLFKQPLSGDVEAESEPDSPQNSNVEVPTQPRSPGKNDGKASVSSDVCSSEGLSHDTIRESDDVKIVSEDQFQVCDSGEATSPKTLIQSPECRESDNINVDQRQEHSGDETASQKTLTQNSECKESDDVKVAQLQECSGDEAASQKMLTQIDSNQSETSSGELVEATPQPENSDNDSNDTSGCPEEMSKTTSQCDDDKTAFDSGLQLNEACSTDNKEALDQGEAIESPLPQSGEDTQEEMASQLEEFILEESEKISKNAKKMM